MSKVWPSAKKHLIPGSGIYPLGYVANGVYSGVKANKNKDISLVLSPHHPCLASAVFTKNKFCAAPVQVSKSILENSSGSKPLLGVIVNSGCANACTGSDGLRDAKEMVSLADKSKDCIVMSTGVIGQKLQMEKIRAGVKDAIASAGNSHDHWMAAAQGIMTTDTFPKLISKEFKTARGVYRMAGWSKGAGMIHPNMATMLSSVFTDCNVSQELLKVAVKNAADRSFNAISIDGDTSTNDTFAVFANGAAKMEPITNIKSEEFAQFQSNLTYFATELAKLIVRDGEGATKFVQVKVSVLFLFSL